MTTTPAATGVAATLRRLYFVRFGFALVWAVLLFLTASSISLLTAALLVLYPVFDVAAAVVDARSARVNVAGGSANGSAAGLYVNIAISTLAAVGLAVALTSGIPAVLRVWGAWAVVAGIVQLVVAIRRRRLGGQWAMIASGAISVLAGVSFFLMASSAGASLANVAGYALLGGVFFLVSALRLGRNASQSTGWEELT
ncbi:DUF308 domain-containing protein [Saccharopolyspora phatthalungensis]|uniref:Uncharacterized membrane protein HdeD (DUF308 family) n=1 Tax=Saccharopolyspora phatthalungensis TaxID=664693 RepID=A0A840QI01_9PSEU|nr:DUF308 domain-containing protein [Saccharopolyspora phatthalungensis]MBB5158299.1 uncharacterized membrane protein HdeD (DUF308 family) [Saccharopolyspora phatthalungensis]